MAGSKQFQEERSSVALSSGLAFKIKQKSTSRITKFGLESSNNFD